MICDEGFWRECLGRLYLFADRRKLAGIYTRILKRICILKGGQQNLILKRMYSTHLLNDEVILRMSIGISSCKTY